MKIELGKLIFEFYRQEGPGDDIREWSSVLYR